MCTPSFPEEHEMVSRATGSADAGRVVGDSERSIAVGVFADKDVHSHFTLHPFWYLKYLETVLGRDFSDKTTNRFTNDELT